MTVSCLVDTDWIIHYLNGQPEIVSKLQELQGRGVAVSLVSLAELYEGTYYSHDPEAREGTRGRPAGRDFHFQNNRNPFRCQRISVSGFTIVRASRHSKNLES